MREGRGDKGENKHCQAMSNVEIGGNDLLQIYNVQQIKGTVSDKKNLQISLDIQKNTFQLKYVPFFSKNCTILTEKQLFIRFHSLGTERRFSTQKISLNFRIKSWFFYVNKCY